MPANSGNALFSKDAFQIRSGIRFGPSPGTPKRICNQIQHGSKTRPSQKKRLFGDPPQDPSGGPFGGPLGDPSGNPFCISLPFLRRIPEPTFPSRRMRF